MRPCSDAFSCRRYKREHPVVRRGLGVGAQTRYIPIQHIADVFDEDAAAGPGSAAFLLLKGPFLRATNPVEERVIALIEPTAAGLGYRIVRVRLSGNRRKRLQIMGERVSDGEMGIDDCSKLSRALGPVFDLDDPVDGEYDLEISSPGIDRPLMRIEDFERFKGHEAKLETAAMTDNQRRYKGVISAVEGDVIVLATDTGETRLKFNQLSDARLVLTDRLIDEDLKRAKAAEAAGEQTADEG